MGKLHEVIVAEEDLKGQNKKILVETGSVFNNKATHFEESIQVYDADSEGSETETEKHTPMITKVHDRLDYQGKISSKYFDALLQKETANTKAKADITLEDGTVLAANVPVSALLGFEREFKLLRGVYNTIPVLDPGKVWADVSKTFGEGVVENQAPKKKRTEKVTEAFELAKATDRHAAQVQMISKDIVVGHTTTTTRSSKYSSAQKHDILGRLDSIILATKQARMRANMTEVENVKAGSALFAFINDGNAPKK